MCLPSCVTLHDPHAPPIVDPGFFADGATGPNGESFDAKKSTDMQALIFGMHEARKLARSEPFASMIEPGSVSTPLQEDS